MFLDTLPVRLSVSQAEATCYCIWLVTVWSSVLKNQVTLESIFSSSAITTLNQFKETSTNKYKTSPVESSCRIRASPTHCISMPASVFSIWLSSM